MGMLTFSEDEPKIFIVPRIDDDQIDDLFYQEDEIGEMRHTAFMIECGLEKDPPDGPDVPPVPWRLDQLQAAAEAEETPRRSKGRTPKRAPPNRAISMDMGFDTSPAKPRRKLAATKSGSLQAMQRRAGKTHSTDGPDDGKDKTSPRSPKRLVAAKSGSLHGMRDATRKAREPRLTKLTAAKSGSLHGMRNAAQKAKEEEEEEEDVPLPPMTRLIATKSGTLKGMRGPPGKPKRTDKRLDEWSSGGTTDIAELKKKAQQLVKEREFSKTDTESSDDDFLSDVSSSSDESDVSIDTDDDLPKQPEETRRRVFRNGKLVEDTGPTTKSKTEAATKKSKSRSTRSNNVAENYLMKTVKTSSAKNCDVPPAFRSVRPKAGSTRPRKSASVADINSNAPSAFQATQKSQSSKAKKLPKKALSVNEISMKKNKSKNDIPPAFRSAFTKK